MPGPKGRGLESASQAASRLQSALMNGLLAELGVDILMDIETVATVVKSTAVLSHRVLTQQVPRGPQETSDAPSVGVNRAVIAAASDVVRARDAGDFAALHDAIDILSAVLKDV